jgi:hypothetical protein
VVTVSWGWHHHRYAVWREYYACTDDELYYLENCGYDDDDILVGLYIARRARVPLRYVFYEYDRCGRDYYAVSMSFRLPWDIWYCREIPRGYGCPPAYARAYGYYWRGERHYCSNAEIYALVHLQIGVRYYGYTHTAYFADYDACVRRGDRAPFRTIVTGAAARAGTRAAWSCATTGPGTIPRPRTGKSAARPSASRSRSATRRTASARRPSRPAGRPRRARTRGRRRAATPRRPRSVASRTTARSGSARLGSRAPAGPAGLGPRPQPRPARYGGGRVTGSARK